MLKRCVFALSLMILNPALALAQGDLPKPENRDITDTKTISLEDALKRVYQHSPQIWKLRADYKLWDARILQAGLGPNPELSLVAEDILGSAAFTSDRFTQVTLGLAQNIVLGDKLHFRTRLAQFKQQLQYWDYLVQVQDLGTQVYTHYAQLLNLQAEQTLLQDLIANAQSTHQLLSLSVAHGKLAPSVLYQSELTLKSLEAEQYQLGIKHNIGRQNLAALWGETRSDFVLALPATAMPMGSFEQFKQALEQHPRLARWQLEQEQRQWAVKAAQAESVSDVNLSGGLRYHAPLDWGLVLSLNWALPVTNLQQGHLEEARQRQAMWQKEQEIEVQSLEQSLLQNYEMTMAYQQLRELLKHQVQLADLQQSTVQKAFKAGKISYLEVLQAAQHWMQQYRQLQTAEAEFRLARWKLEGLSHNALVQLAVQDKGL